VHVVGRTGKAGAPLNQLLDRRRPLVDRIALAVADEAAALPAGFEHRDVGGERVVARRVGERLGDDNRSPNIIGGEVGPPVHCSSPRTQKPPDTQSSGGEAYCAGVAASDVRLSSRPSTYRSFRGSS